MRVLQFIWQEWRLLSWLWKIKLVSQLWLLFKRLLKVTPLPNTSIRIWELMRLSLDILPQENAVSMDSGISVLQTIIIPKITYQASFSSTIMAQWSIVSFQMVFHKLLYELFVWHNVLIANPSTKRQIFASVLIGDSTHLPTPLVSRVLQIVWLVIKISTA